MGQAYPPIRDLADIEAIERRPLGDYIEHWNTPDLIRAGAALEAGKMALHYLPSGDLAEKPRSFTFDELIRDFNRSANLFRELGVGRTDVIAYLLPNLPETLQILWGGQAAGIVCPVNWMLEARHIIHILRAANPKVLVAQGPAPDYEIWEKVEEIRRQLPGIETVLKVDDFADLRDARPGESLQFEHGIKPGDTAMLIHTGGTTGAPKLARLSHQSMAYQHFANSIGKALSAGDCLFNGGPLFHAGGIINDTLCALANGSTTVMVGPTGFRDKQVMGNYWKIVERYRITRLSGVPTVLTQLAANPPDGEDVSSLKDFMASGAGALPADLARSIEDRLGIRPLVTYGATEFTCNVSMAPRDGEPRYGSSGLRWPFTRIKIVQLDEDGKYLRDCDQDEIGVICVAGLSTIPGYVDEADNAGLFLGDGWAQNGDLGRIDADGYLWVTSRAKDLIIRGGHNIDPRVIDETLVEHGDVALAAAVGKPDAYAGELPVAYVQLHPGARATAPEIMEFARARIPERAAAPREIHILEALPLTQVGKIFKPTLRLDAAGRAFAELLDPLAGNGVALSVSVGEDAKLGSLATVTLEAESADRAAEVESEIHRRLGAFAMAHKVVRL